MRKIQRRWSHFVPTQMKKSAYRRSIPYLNGLRFVFSLALCTLIVWSARGDDVRKTLRMPSSYVYKSMLKFCEKQEYTKIEKSVPFVHPILVEIQTDYDIDLEKEIRELIATGQQQEIYNLIKKLICWDIKHLLDGILTDDNASLQQKRVRLKMAYLDYLLLSPEIRQNQFAMDQKLKNAFKWAHAKAAASDPEALKTHLNQIQAQLLLFFRISSSRKDKGRIRSVCETT